jgi:hypothetical protein
MPRLVRRRRRLLGWMSHRDDKTMPRVLPASYGLPV